MEPYGALARADGSEKGAAVGSDFLEVIRQIRYNVLQFQSGLLHCDAEMRVSGKHELQVRYRPLKRVGVSTQGLKDRHKRNSRRYQDI